MLPTIIKKDIDNKINNLGKMNTVKPPKYNPKTHYIHIAEEEYYRQLIVLRHIVKQISDDFMSRKQEALNVDLFMLTPSISSPMGPGSDSEAIPLQFGKYHSYLTDSSQFGFEPILMNGIKKTYCYLPSLRGERPDKRHLNQFFHCEMEILGDLEEVMRIGEAYSKYLCAGLLYSEALLKKLSKNPKATIKTLTEVINTKSFRRLRFDEACEILIRNGYSKMVNTTKHGRDISSAGETKLLEILESSVPVWIVEYDRHRVPFYQKPHPLNPKKILNADLIFPPLIKGSFGGEILGAGQRQDNVGEMYESLRVQGLSADPYEWYIKLRKNPGYKTTSGFGLGIERFIAWSLALDNIRDAIIYPRLKDVLTNP